MEKCITSHPSSLRPSTGRLLRSEAEKRPPLNIGVMSTSGERLHGRHSFNRSAAYLFFDRAASVIGLANQERSAIRSVLSHLAFFRCLSATCGSILLDVAARQFVLLLAIRNLFSGQWDVAQVVKVNGPVFSTCQSNRRSKLRGLYRRYFVRRSGIINA